MESSGSSVSADAFFGKPVGAFTKKRARHGQRLPRPMQITIEQQTFHAATAVETAHQRPRPLATFLENLPLQAGLAIVAGRWQAGLDVSYQGPNVFECPVG